MSDDGVKIIDLLPNGVGDVGGVAKQEIEASSTTAATVTWGFQIMIVYYTQEPLIYSEVPCGAGTHRPFSNTTVFEK